MFDYKDSNQRLVYLLSGFVLLVFGGVSIHSFIKGEIELGVIVLGILTFQLIFLCRLVYTVRFDFTGLTKKWLFRDRVIHFPINKISKISYTKRVFGGFSRKAFLKVHMGKEKELIPLLSPRNEHYELLRLIHNCGIEIDFFITIGYYTRKATKNEIDNLFTFE